MNYSDQTKIFNQETFGHTINLIGMGGIGNSLALLLPKMGIRSFEFYDTDCLEMRNMPTEVAYSANDVGCSKIDAAIHTMQYLMGNEMQKICVKPHYEYVDSDTYLEGIVICGVDSMASRKEIWEAVKANFYNIPLYIDARSSGEYVTIFAFDPSDAELSELYENDWLYDDEEALELECGARNIGYISLLIAGHIGRLITRFHRNIKVEFITSANYTDYAGVD